MTRKRGKAKFIALEGGEGTGKSTQGRMLTERLRKKGIPAEQVHKPGTTALGLHLRKFLKGDHPVAPEAELLLFAAQGTMSNWPRYGECRRAYPSWR